VDNSFQAAGIAGALLRYLTEQGMEQNAENAAKALKELSGEEIPQAIRYYEMLLAGKSLTELRKAVELDRHASLVDIV